MNKVVGNALLYSTRHPEDMFHGTRAWNRPIWQRTGRVFDQRIAKIGGSTPRENPPYGRWKDRGRTCVSCSLAPSRTRQLAAPAEEQGRTCLELAGGGLDRIRHAIIADTQVACVQICIW